MVGMTTGSGGVKDLMAHIMCNNLERKDVWEAITNHEITIRLLLMMHVVFVQLSPLV